MDEYNTNIEQQVSWNLSQQLLLEIGGLLMDASKHYTQWNFKDNFGAMKSVKNRVIQSLNDRERENFQLLETEIIKLIGITDNQKLKEHHVAVWTKCRTQLMNRIDTYNELIMDTLERYGYLISKKEDHKKVA